MSIFPKILTKGKDTFTTFHMKVCNNSDEAVEGQIKYKIVMPDGKIDEMNLNRTEKIKVGCELNRYDKYYIKENYLTGRYFVNGTFCCNGMSILSDTNKNDFFDIIEGD